MESLKINHLTGFGGKRFAWALLQNQTILFSHQVVSLSLFQLFS
jgi:hypothetical protein